MKGKDSSLFILREQNHQADTLGPGSVPSTIRKGKTFCHNCKKKCSGEVLRVQDKYFHIGCFKCQGQS
uniref:LIM zinc-binding domain-containing protein n=1 Tax=Timema genevievae TaxID=629358 RepID=A0A7R9PRZ3_TIMGE|nr:unnamed protein product [Timema genevievae]